MSSTSVTIAQVRSDRNQERLLSVFFFGRNGTNQLTRQGAATHD